MTTINYDRTGSEVYVVTYGNKDFDLTQGNTTAQNIILASVPAPGFIKSVHYIGGPDAVTGSGLTSFDVTVGKTAGGTEFIGSTNIEAADVTISDVASENIKKSNVQNVVAQFAPSGANWNELTIDNTQGTFYILFEDITGSILR